MAGELIAGLGLFKSMLDMAKGLKDINDAAIRNGAVIELQEKILAAREQQSTLLERISDLEKQVAGFEKWETEKKRYYLQEIYPRTFAYSINENARGSEPPHLICAKCYEDHKKVILQKSSAVHLSCPSCKTQIQFKDSSSSRGASWG
jgi:hypothetical protein